MDLDNMEHLSKFIEDSQTQAEEKARRVLAEQGFDYDFLVKEVQKKPAPRLRFSAEEAIAQLRNSGINDSETEKRIHQAEKMLNEAYRDYGHYFPPGPPIPGGRFGTNERGYSRRIPERGKFGRQGFYRRWDLANLDLAGVDLKGSFS